VVGRCRPRIINICYRGGAPQDVDASSESRGESVRQCIGKVSTFVLRIVASEVLGIRSPFGPNFQVLAFLIGCYWLLTGTVSTRRNATGMSWCWRLRGHAVKLGANSLSLLVVSGCSAKASEASLLDPCMGATIATTQCVSAVDTFCFSFTHSRCLTF
jgi:hypothetical protein